MIRLIKSSNSVWLLSKIKLFFLVAFPKYVPRKLKRRYWFLLSKLQGNLYGAPRIVGIADKVIQDQNLIELVFSDNEATIVQSDNRISRFLLGSSRAQDRLWDIYIGQFDLPESLIDFSVPCLDIGANVGEFALASQKRGIPKVYAFEPDPRAYACLVANTRVAFGKDSIECLNLAVGEVNELKEFHLSTTESDSSFLRPVQVDKSIQVEVIRLKDFIAREKIEKIGILKMDAEGFEPEVLIGLGDYIKSIQVMAIDVSEERNGATTSAEVCTHLSRYGFRWITSSKINKRKIVLASRNW